MKLQDGQRNALVELGKKLRECSRVPKAPAELDLKDPVRIQYSNVFGVLGPRGAGKSTLLKTFSGIWSLPQHLLEGKEAGTASADDWALKVKESLGELYVLRPLDCSVVNPELAPGAAVLLHLERELGGEAKLGDRQRSDLSRLLEEYVRTTRQFRTLSAELSASEGEYTESVIKSSRNRLDLSRRLSQWIDLALGLLGKMAFVVLLDDFDLVHAREVRSWLLSLLDELHQGKMMVVLTADYHRLEHLSFDIKAEIDDLTGRALLEKILPAQNRINLARWEIQDRSDFGIEGGAVAGEVHSLKERIQRYSCQSGAQEQLLTRLLPGLPRGLVNLARTLESQGENPDMLQFLVHLASCRGEPLLAREFQEVDLATLVSRLQFRRQTENGSWQEAVKEACLRGIKGEHAASGSSRQALAPISILRPDPPRTRVGSAAHTPQFDLSGRDHLRHEEYRYRAVKDADERLTPVWVEVLLNFALREKEGMADNHIRFGMNLPPVRARLHRSRFKVQLGRVTQRALFDDRPVPVAALLWLRWEKDIDSDLNIGWEPLISALQKERSIWPLRPWDQLSIDVEGLTGELPLEDSSKSLRLFPDEVWAMILLTDGLERCPWDAVSAQPLGWELHTYLAFAAVFVRTAYLSALERIKMLPANLSTEQHVLLGVLRKRNPLDLLKLRREEFLDWAGVILSDDLEKNVCKDDSPLAKAMIAFLTSPSYTGIRDLLKDA